MMLAQFASPAVDLNLDPELASRLEGALGDLLTELGIRQTIMSGRRSIDAQSALFRTYYTTRPLTGRPSKIWQGQRWWQRPGYPEAAIPGTSRHERGLAVDLALPAGPARAVRLALLAPYLRRWGLTNTRVRDEPWHVELDPAGPPTPGTEPEPTTTRRRHMTELVFDIDRNAWYLSGPVGLARVINVDTLNLYRDGLTVNGATIAEPVPVVVHKQGVFDAVCAPRVLPGVTL